MNQDPESPKKSRSRTLGMAKDLEDYLASLEGRRVRTAWAWRGGWVRVPLGDGVEGKISGYDSTGPRVALSGQVVMDGAPGAFFPGARDKPNCGEGISWELV